MTKSILIENKNIMIFGLGITGISTAEYINRHKGKVIILDSKDKNELKNELKELENKNIDYRMYNTEDVDIEKIDLIIKSPGIPYDNNILKIAKKNNIEVVTDIELAYRNSLASFIAITGTNGKTTVTTLIGDIFKKQFKKVYIAGNIGIGILSYSKELEDSESIFIIESSSFQLEGTRDFRPNISLLINITPDHINWHKNMEHYINCKKNILRNQLDTDISVMNYDDEILRKMGETTRSRVLYFSVDSELEQGVFVKNKEIVYRNDNELKEIIDVTDIKVLGKHNIENILGAIGVSVSHGIKTEYIKDAIENFYGVEHRIEFVREVNGIKFYNDSKGTNTDASKKAIESIPYPINLIAGGMDKGEDFSELIEKSKEKIERLILIGETSKKIKEEGERAGIKNIYIAKDMEEAVRLSYENTGKDSNVLLSPACASWDMYENYEVRGNEFKDKVMKIKERENEK